MYALISNAGGLGRVRLPMSFGIGKAIVVTGSMEPAIPGNSYIFVKSQKDYFEGDIVAYESGNEVIVHRIVKTDGDEIITKGDANNVEDEPITKDKIKGKILFHIPHVGTVLRMFKTPFGSMILVLLAFGFLVFSRGDDEEEKEKQNEGENK